jgi:hypothetical protein
MLQIGRALNMLKLKSILKIYKIKTQHKLADWKSAVMKRGNYGF